MAEHSNIEWTDATWNPITGCELISPGCTNCYAMRLAGTRLRNHPSRIGLTELTKTGPVWNGTLRLNEQWLDQPVRWGTPRRIFVCAHGDLFHDSVPVPWIDAIWAVMAACPHHTFQVLTKRADRMNEYLHHFCDINNPEAVSRHIGGLMGVRVFRLAQNAKWPLPNVHLGVSVEDQKRANERIPTLMLSDAAVRWISAEPLLAPIDISDLRRRGQRVDATTGRSGVASILYQRLDWVVVGGESGPRARDMDANWARSLREQCREADVPFFMKQMAHKAPIPLDLQIRQPPRGTVEQWKHQPSLLP